MLEEWTSAAKPKLDQAIMVEHIEKMVEVRLQHHQLWSLWDRGDRSVVVSQGCFDQGTALGATTSAGLRGQCSVNRRHGVQLMGGLGMGVWRREVVGKRELPTS